MEKTGTREFRRGLRGLERQVELALLDQTECCGVTPAQCHLLLEIEERGEASVGELAASFELDASTLSRTVDGLVKIGFVERRVDPANRRRQLVTLSATGKSKADDINERCDRYYEGLLERLSEKEAKTILRALPRFVEAMRAFRLAGNSASCCAEKAEVAR